MKRTLIALALLALVGGAATAQPGPWDFVIYNHAGPLLLFDSANPATIPNTNIIPQQVTQTARGGCMNFDGTILATEATTNGVAVYDPFLGAWEPSGNRTIYDPGNAAMGFPYGITPNHENAGGFGLWGFDGNPAPAPAPTGQRNTFVVDYSTTPPGFWMNTWMASTAATPMADVYTNLANPNYFLGVGFYTNDTNITEYEFKTPLGGTPVLETPTILGSLASAPCRFDATMVETDPTNPGSGQPSLACYADNQIAFYDMFNKTVNMVKTTGIPAGYAGLAAFPWEQAGMKGYVFTATADCKAYEVDLYANPITPINTYSLPATTYNVNTARHREEHQLTSWFSKAGNSPRNLHVNFGPQAAGDLAVVVPNVAGIPTNPLLISGQEIFFNIDFITLLALNGLLGYNPVVVLDANGEADVVHPGLGSPTPVVNAFWIAVRITGSTFTDVSNVISVRVF